MNCDKSPFICQTESLNTFAENTPLDVAVLNRYVTDSMKMSDVYPEYFHQRKLRRVLAQLKQLAYLVQ
jgi:hypothetical protein